MSRITAASSATVRSYPTRRSVTHVAIIALAALGMLAGTGHAADAQTTPAAPAMPAVPTTPTASAAPTTPTAPTKRWDLTIPGGMVIPTGAQRGGIKRANLTAVQVSYLARPAVALTATVSWARSRDVASLNEPRLDVFTYDAGVEMRGPRWGEMTTLRPFAGFGAGARSYNYRSLDVDATHNFAAYGSIGGELGRGRFGLRVEARDYVTGFKPLDGRGAGDTRNDVVLMVGLRFAWR